MSNPLNIMVCFKAVVDLDMFTKDDWQIDAGYNIDSTLVRKVFSSYDEAALELALKLADSGSSINQPTMLTALTIGDATTDLFLTHCYAVNFDRAVGIVPNGHTDLRFNPLAIADLISRYQRVITAQDLIILGNQSDDGQNGQTAMLLAEHLRWPCITQVTHVDLTTTPHTINVSSLQDGVILRQQVTLPLILAVGNSTEMTTLRLATLKSKLYASKQKVIHYQMSDLETDKATTILGNDKQLNKLYQQHQQHEKTCQIIEGQDAIAKAQHIYQHYIKQYLKQDKQNEN